jgi:hypothetical protein
VTHALGWLPEDIPKDARVTPVVSAAPPTHFEWTQKDGLNWMTSVKNQGGCGSCVAFAAVGALEGQLKIQANNSSWGIDLSEQHLFSCGGGTCSGGWYISSALNYLQQYGTPDEACSPYQGGSGSCSNSCPDWQSRASKISSWSWVANNTSAIEAALINGPLVAGFTVYADFYYRYNGGVYHWDHVSQPVGGHAIVIVGYDQPGQYWIVKNSWGPNWGEKGYFRIGFGEAGIENYVASIKASTSAPSTYTVTFYADPASGTITADGSSKSNGATGTYGSGARVHVIANPPTGYSFSYWETSGVSVDSTSSADTYTTVSNNGWLKAHFDLVPNLRGDFVVWSSSTGIFWVKTSRSGYTQWFTVPWGIGNDKPILADVDGDGKSDLIVWSSTSGLFWVKTSTSNYASWFTARWGSGSDIPMVADVDGDGKADFIVWSSSSGLFWVLTSSSGYKSWFTVAWGSGSDIPMVADVDGDGKADFVVWSPTTGMFWVKTSTSGYSSWLTAPCGSEGDIPMVADVDGDGKGDLVVWSPSTGIFSVMASSSSWSSLFTTSWGHGNDIPAVANLE